METYTQWRLSWRPSHIAGWVRRGRKEERDYLAYRSVQGGDYDSGWWQKNVMGEDKTEARSQF